MSKILDNGLVALALVASVGYALSSLGPKGLRRRLWAAIQRLAANAPAALRLAGLARRLEERAAEKSAGACGGCGSCDSGASQAGKERAPEVAIPLEKIGRRQ